MVMKSVYTFECVGSSNDVRSAWLDDLLIEPFQIVSIAGDDAHGQDLRHFIGMQLRESWLRQPDSVCGAF